MLAFVSLFLTPKLSLQQQCRSSANLGGVECVLFSQYYDDYQWATCLTNDYIRRSSNQRHICRNNARYCWYQCMIEFYNEESGTVTDGCRCSPGGVATVQPPTDSLAPECYSPIGEDCRWYRNCLEVRYPCQGTGDAYAIEYAQKFCDLYSNNYNDFSRDGRAWVDAVRQCLQVALVPSLRPWVSKTCRQLRDDAFDSHDDCYVNRGSGAPGICELSCSDVWKSFWLVNFEGGACSTAPVETGRQMLSVMERCLERGAGCIPTHAQTPFYFSVPYVPLHLQQMAAVEIVCFVAGKLHWPENGFRWFSFLDNDDENSGNRNKRQVTDENVGVKVLLADTKVLNIFNGRTPVQGLNLSQITNDLVKAVNDGIFLDIPLILDGNKMSLKISSIGQCTDTFCNSTEVIELARSPPSNGGKRLQYLQLPYVVVLYGIFIFY